MSFPARVFRVLIGSPADVEAEREIAVRTIQEWNDLNAAERQIVLLPLRWETHSAPGFGKRPQEIINAQVVDHCDILVGVFWTRIGTPTGGYESGSLEEIDRVASSGRPVMLYFSEMKQEPDEIDIDQLAKLREFKKKTYSNALIERYSTHVEFRDKLSKHLEIQLRSLLADASAGDALSAQVRPVTDIRLEFADAKSGKPIGKSLSIAATRIEIEDFDALPDFELPVQPETTAPGGGSFSKILAQAMAPRANKNYYRELALHVMQENLFRPVRFWLKNTGGIGARDVFVELSFRCDKDNLLLLSAAQLPAQRPSISDESPLTGWHFYASHPQELFASGSTGWNTNLELAALQPQREISPEPAIVIGTAASCSVTVDARIFADTLSRPLNESLNITVEVIQRRTTADAFVRALGTGNPGKLAAPEASR